MRYLAGAITAAACFLLSVASVAANDAFLNGTWTGQYSCRTGLSDMTVTTRDGASRVKFRTANGHEGEFSARMRYLPNTRQVYIFPEEWINRPARLRMVEYHGKLSEDGKSIVGTIPQCNWFNIARASAPDSAARAAADRAPQPAPSSTSISPKADAVARPWPPVAAPASASSINLAGTWTGQYSCSDGRSRLSMSLSGSRGEVEMTDAKVATSGKFRVSYSLDTTTKEVLIKPLEIVAGGSDFKMVEFRGSLSLDMRSITGVIPTCTWFHLSKEGDDAPKVVRDAGALLPSEKVRYSGAWDGAIIARAYIPKSGVPRETWRSMSEEFHIRPMSVYFRRSESSPNSNDVWVSVAGKAGQYLIRPEMKTRLVSEEIVISPPDLRGEDAIRASFSLTQRPNNPADPWTMIGKATFGVIVLRPRVGDPETSLMQVCEKTVRPLLKKKMEGKEAATKLKLALISHLGAYDPDTAGVNEAALALSDQTKIPPNLLTRTMFDCVVTNSFIDNGSDVAGFFSPGIARWQVETLLERGGGANTNFNYPYDQIDLPARAQTAKAANEALSSAAASYLNQKSKSSGDFLTENLETIQAASPVHAFAVLDPLVRQFEQLDRLAEASAVNAFKERARERMRGIPIPRETASRETMFARVTGGLPGGISDDDKTYIAGMFAKSVRECGVPDVVTRARLAETYLMGMANMIGLGSLTTATPGAAFMAPIQGTLSAAEGESFVQSIGCGHPYLKAFYDLLLVDQPVKVKPSLFVQTCSVHRSIEQCTCLQKAVTEASGDASGTVYTQDTIRDTRRRLLWLGPGFAKECGIQNN